MFILPMISNWMFFLFVARLVQVLVRYTLSWCVRKRWCDQCCHRLSKRRSQSVLVAGTRSITSLHSSVIISYIRPD